MATSTWRYLGKWVGLPAVIYLLFFIVLTWPWMAHFSDGHIFANDGDGLQNVWNMWWVNKSVTQLHELPFFTSYLHYPFGVTLLAQTLNPFNGLVAIGLIPLFGLAVSHNIMIVFSFVASGLTAFWLCHYFAKKYLASMIGGFKFTFSSYHLAHAHGHMQLVSVEWVPLFILLWWMLLTKPRYRTAVGAAVVLLLVVLCDYYYFLFSVVLAVFIGLYLWRKRLLATAPRGIAPKPWLLFVVLSGIVVAPLPLALMKLSSQVVLLGVHDARTFSPDPLTFVVHSALWRFNALTKWYWQEPRPGFDVDLSVYLGISVIVLLIVSWVRRKKLHYLHLGFWQVVLVAFAVLSLGPRLTIRGEVFESVPLPYALFERLFPFLALSGVPVRMVMVVTLSAAIISSMVLARLRMEKPLHRVVLIIFCGLLIFEMWPARLPLTPATHPRYVAALRDLPNGAVIDAAAPSQGYALYFQTVHQKKEAFGYVSRLPQTTSIKNQAIVSLVNERKFNTLCQDYDIRYLTVRKQVPLFVGYTVVYEDDMARIYDFMPTQC